MNLNCNFLLNLRILCDNAHAAMLKACDSFGIKKIMIPVDKNYRMNNYLVKKAINSNTIGIIASFPSFPHGIEDDIEGLSEIACYYNLPLHVDCCLGGLLVAFYGTTKIKLPKFDFSLRGVTTISADYHKYGQACKGISVVLFKTKELRRDLFYIYPKATSGIELYHSYNGTKTPVYAVSAYGILLNMGRQKMNKQAKDIQDTIIKITDYVRKEIPELEVLGDPKVSFTNKKKDLRNWT